MLIKIFDIPSEYALGIIILGSCPGGTASNLIAYLCRADVALSIICTFASTLVSVVLTPLLILLLSNEKYLYRISRTSKVNFFNNFFSGSFRIKL